MKDDSRAVALGDLLVASSERIFELNGDHWTYGWYIEGYRRHSDAAIGTQNGRVRLTREGVSAYERAMTEILKSPPAHRWEADELWGVVASMVATLPRDPVEAELEAGRRLSSLLSSAPSLVAFAVANVEWKGQSLAIADAVLGSANPEFVNLVDSVSAGRPRLLPGERPRWRKMLGGRGRAGREVPIFAAWVDAHGQMAVSAAEEVFDNILGVALLIGPDPNSLGLYSLRGDSHKPGIRGLALHRPAFKGARLRDELAAEIVQVDERRESTAVHWHGEHPFPLWRLVEQPVADEIGYVVPGHTSMTRRLRTAGRWFAKAHWATDPEDAALALGIALDAMLAEAGGSPGRVLAERFALLEADRRKRPDRARQLNDFYQLRSAVAHGSRPGSLLKEAPSQMMTEVRWCARRLLDNSRAHEIHSEKDHSRFFDNLKWGL